MRTATCGLCGKEDFPDQMLRIAGKLVCGPCQDEHFEDDHDFDEDDSDDPLD